MAASVNPTVRRRRLGSELRRLRERKGLTAEEVASRLLVSQSKISRLENGRRSISPRDVRDLCQVYGVEDERVIESLMTMAKESRQRGWWHAFGDVPYSVYIGLEAEATVVRNYESLFIPGLLQTRDYAEAVVTGMQPEVPAEVVDQRVNVRLARQARITTDERPMRFWAVVDEAALHRQVGGNKVMGEQMRRLLEMSELPHVTIQVVPFDIGAHPGMTGAFSIMSFPESADADVVYLEGVTSDLYVERPMDVHRYTVMYEHLTAVSLGPTESRERITELADAYEAERPPGV
ncbi:transcriptional regulator [Mangrovactinospora gilvigrisea]|uniref:Transcriptional regulator n=1 Tax=Mangrovactinospora gilvigrisea TaxID=1428644 RepID=A0A1J7BD74_9ACTN|nr:helix-turn-helix transcriptional regulator [Mangrovactinospora gilvigrisea]OIV36533.1 transcriptional regulator [Mangrovactinospora gilvigrisea]